jgi:spermidine synthase
MDTTARPDRSRGVPIWPLLLLFVLSGAAGLIYEVVWARQLVLVFGNTSQATATILTGFFGGLAVGGAVGGRIADRVTRPLRLYGLLELVVVVVVLVTPFTFRLVGEAYRGVYETLATSPLALALVRFGLSILALAPATLLMGATLPTLTRYLARGPRGLAGAFQRLYAANTIGAIFGTLAAGFVLIEVLGLAGALSVGALCSATAGLVALALDWGLGRSAAVTPPVPTETALAFANAEAFAFAADAGPAAPAPGAVALTSDADPAPALDPPLADPTPKPGLRGPRRLALSLAFVSGLTSLGYQVVWNRMLGAGTGSSTYVFTIILALFLTGIAIGAVILGVVRPRRAQAPVLIGVAQLVTALLAVAGASVLASPAKPFSSVAPDFMDALRSFAWAAAVVVLPPTIAMGMTFPATASLLGEQDGAEGAASGSLLAANTVGSIAATFALPFLVIPLIGSPATLACLVITNALVGGTLLARSAWGGRAFRWVGGAAGGVVVALVMVSLVSGTTFRNPTTTLLEQKGGQVFQATEDEIASVVAGRGGGYPQLWVAGTSMTLITVDTKFMPLLPLALRPNATRALAIAFGMGTAFRTSLRAGVKTDVVELVPSVPEMFHWYYEDAPQVLADPNGKVIIADGRNHVELTDQMYDFVFVDPPPPVESSGVSVISSLEFYQAAKARLNPQGVMVQWVPYGQTLDEFLAHVRTFLTVFPNVTVVAGAGGYGLYMIGSDGPVDLTEDAITAVLDRPGVLADVNDAPDSHGRSAADWAATMLHNTWASGDELRAAVGNGPLVTDDRPLPEYFLIRRLTHPNPQMLSLSALRSLLQ